MRILRTAAVTAASSLCLTLGVPSPAPALVTSCLAVLEPTAKARSYAMTMRVTQDGRTVTSERDIEKPDRLHETTPRAETISIGSTNWTRVGSGPWTAHTMPFSIGALMPSDPLKTLAPALQTCVQSTGRWDGQPAIVLETTGHSAAGPTATTIYAIKGLIRHVDGTWPGGASSIDFSKYDAVRISSPAGG